MLGGKGEGVGMRRLVRGGGGGGKGGGRVLMLNNVSR